jgi:isochorismate hydrolase
LFVPEASTVSFLAEDAMSSMAPGMHESSVNFVLKLIGRVRSTEQILDALE